MSKNQTNEVGININDFYVTKSDLVKITGLDYRSINQLLTIKEVELLVSEDLESKSLPEIKIHKNAIPIIKSKYEEIKSLYNLYKVNPEYLSARDAARLLNRSNNEIIQMIHSGVWKEGVISLLKLKTPRKKNPDPYNYFIKKEMICENRFKTLREIADSNLISYSSLRRYSSMGLLPQPDHLKGSFLYDEHEILTHLTKIRDLMAQNIDVGKECTLYSLLNNEQQNAIKEYLSFIKNGGIVQYNGYKSRKVLSKIDKKIEATRRILSSAFCLIISGRCDIEEDIFVGKGKNLVVPNNWDACKFDCFSITQNDYLFISKHRKETTLIQYGMVLKAFYYYYLQTTEQEAVLEEHQYRKFLSSRMRVQNFLNQFPTSNTEINTDDINYRVKCFLTREQLIVIRDLILNNPRYRDPVKYATIWMFTCSSGTRPEEYTNIRIEHFSLDDNGFLKLNDRGWGVLDIPASISKHGRSPSHKLYKTPICPETVNQINFYLSKLYKRQGILHPRGKGFLFRPDYKSPERSYSDDCGKKFIESLKPLLTFLSGEQQRDFELKASRRSMNNLIDGYGVNLSKFGIDYRVQKVAADYQMRHKVGQDVGEKHYTAEISEDQYYEVLDKTINFPWNFEMLEAWEIKLGYRKANLNTSNFDIVEKIEPNIIEIPEKINRLKWIESRIKDLKTRPKNMSITDWLSEVDKLEKEKKYLSSL